MNINTLTDSQLLRLKRIVQEAQLPVICCHKSPDGDALGASLAWAEYLRTQGKEPQIIVPDAYPDFLHWLPNTEKVIRYDKHTEKGDMLLAAADVIYCLDFNNASRLSGMQAAFEASKAPRVLIDHHLDPALETVLMVSRPDMCSTSELIFRLIWQLGGFEEMTKKCAIPIYCGMMTDTGAFTYNSSSPAIYFIIGQLLTKHIDKDKIYRNVYYNLSPWALRLRGHLMSRKLNVLNDLHASYFTISRKDMADFHFIKGDAEGLVNEPLRIKGMRLSVSLREDDRTDNLIWVSLRSVDDFPCNKMAAEFFNGGGHLNASGGRLYCSLTEAETVVRQAFQRYATLLRG